MTTPTHDPGSRWPDRRLPSLLILLLALPIACQVTERGPESRDPEAIREPAGDTALATTLRQAAALADSIEELLRPVPLMRPGDEAALRQYPNAVHVRTARRLGVSPGDTAELSALVEQGRLVPLRDSTGFWVLREMDVSRPLVTPATRTLLERIGQTFQDRLAAMGLPPLRFEISSALRTPAAQAALRRDNPNATAGTSAHEFGTTVDIPYSAYAAPAALPPGLLPENPGSAGPDRLDLVARYAIERMAARKSRELKAILAEVLREAQGRGEVLVTLERQQPVFHITVAGS
jgi:hypothetical protein